MRTRQQGFGELLAAIVMLLLVAVVPYVLGVVIENNAWRRDCEKLSAHRDGSQVYHCSPAVEEEVE